MRKFVFEHDAIHAVSKATFYVRPSALPYYLGPIIIYVACSIVQRLAVKYGMVEASNPSIAIISLAKLASMSILSYY